MELQGRLTQYSEQAGDAEIQHIIKELEKNLRKDGFSGERAYRVLCDLLIVKSYYEGQGSQSVESELAGKNSFHSGIREVLDRLDLGDTKRFSDGLDDLSEERLKFAIKLLDGFSITDIDMDIFGFFYGEFFSDVFRGESGKFFTPRHVVSAMVELASPGPNEVIADPACGSGGFLVWTSQLLENGSYSLLGNDNDSILADTARANLYIAGEDNAKITSNDLFEGEYICENRESMDLILANPPFSLKYEKNQIWGGFGEYSNNGTVISDYLFLDAAQHLLKSGGRLVSLFPMSMITNKNHAPFRKMLREYWSELACVTLPEGVFYPYSGSAAQACILMLVKDREGPYYKYPTLKANVNNIGYSTSKKQFTPIQQNDFEDLFSSSEYAKFKEVRREIL